MEVDVVKNLHLTLVPLSIVLLVAGCGGGGSSSNTPNTSIPVGTVQITASNATTAAKGAATPSQTMVKQGTTGATASKAATQSGASSKSVMDIALAQLKRVERIKLPALAASVVGASISPFPVTFGCGSYANTNSYANTLNSTSGTMAMDIQGTTNANTGAINITSATLTYVNCVEPNPAAVSATTTTNGSMTLTIGSKSGGVINATTGYLEGTVGSPLRESVSMSFTNFSVLDTAPTTPETLTTNGGFTLGIVDTGTQMTVTMSGSSFVMVSSIDGTSSMKNFSIVNTVTAATGAYNYTISMTVASTASNLVGDIVITTPVAFQGIGSGNPTVGKMVVYGSSNSSLTLEVVGAGVAVTVNDGTTATQPVYSATLTWAQL